jgi:hypothetical protein
MPCPPFHHVFLKSLTIHTPTTSPFRSPGTARRRCILNLNVGAECTAGQEKKEVRHFQTKKGLRNGPNTAKSNHERHLPRLVQCDMWRGRLSAARFGSERACPKGRSRCALQDRAEMKRHRNLVAARRATIAHTRRAWNLPETSAPVGSAAAPNVRPGRKLATPCKACRNHRTRGLRLTV